MKRSATKSTLAESNSKNPRVDNSEKTLENLTELSVLDTIDEILRDHTSMYSLSVTNVQEEPAFFKCPCSTPEPEVKLNRENNSFSSSYPNNSPDKSEYQNNLSSSSLSSDFFLHFSLHNCPSCLEKYENNGEKQKNVCGHDLCGSCYKKIIDKTGTCSQCQSIFEDEFQDEQTSNAPVLNEKFSADPNIWLFNDVQDETDVYLANNPYKDLIMETLKKFNIDNFRLSQLAAISASLQSLNTFILMPSGGGKSLIYQLPALLSFGVTIVISPLRSLIIDQVNSLQKKNINAAHLIGDDSSINNEILNDLQKKSPLIKLLYITPERFKRPAICKLLVDLASKSMITRIVIDEAHCVATWGVDFRRSYLQLKQIFKNCVKEVPISLFTASATPQIRQSIVYLLGLEQHKLVYFLSNFDRPNLQYESICVNISQKNDLVLEALSSAKFRNKPGIVYCLSKKECETMAEFLCKNGIAAKCYHASLSDSTRNRVQAEWTDGQEDCRIMVATIAFGMGVNKPNVPIVIHCGLPKSLEGYYQESGRAGRNGSNSLCLMIWSTNDYKKWQMSYSAKRLKIEKMKDLDEAKKNRELQTVTELEKALDEMFNFAKNKNECKRKLMLKYFGQEYNPIQCRSNLSTICDNCLNNLTNSLDSDD